MEASNFIKYELFNGCYVRFSTKNTEQLHTEQHFAEQILSYYTYISPRKGILQKKLFCIFSQKP